MKKSNFINSSLLFCLVLMLMTQNFTTYAQNNSPLCGVNSSTTSVIAAAVVNPTNCSQLFTDLVPSSLDPTLDVNVNFWVFKPTIGASSSAWTNLIDPTTMADIQQCLNGANNNFSALAPPSLPVPGVPYVSNSKIRLVLKSLNFVTNDQAYYNISNAAHGNYGYQWHDPAAINVFLGITSSTYVVTTPTGTYTTWSFVPGSIHAGASGTPGVYPNNWIVFNPQFGSSNPNHDNLRNYGTTLSHEVGHVLGLDHTTYRVIVLPNIPPTTVTLNSQSIINPTFGCCSNLEALDFVKDNGLWSPCPGVTFNNVVGAGSNNIMSQNTACGYRYLSPHQIALMHYNLRTDLIRFLPPSSYQAATNLNGLFNYDVNTNEIWASGDRYFKGNIRVKSGKTLTIKCGVAMSKGARIIVETGAQLIIDGGHVTNISGRTWRGIEVMGNPIQSQVVTHPTNSGALLYQGIVRVKNFGKISHADIGVRTHLGNGVAGNGVVITDNAIFENNIVDVEFTQANTVNNPMPSISKFIRTSFITTGSVGEFWQTPLTHASLKNTTGVQFLGCNFQFYPSAGIGAHGDGITSTDAVYYVSNYITNSNSYMSKIENLYRGVYVNNVNPLKVPTIVNTTFKEPAAYGAYFLNTNYLSFKTNTVVFGAYYGMAGVYLNSCKYYKISNNVFEQPLNLTSQDQGLNIYRSKSGSHEVFRNTFSNIKVGINCIDDNSGAFNYVNGLRMNCNVFNQVPNQYDIALTYSPGLSPPTVMFNQGEINPSLMTSNNLVRNLYGATCSNQNKWSIHSSSMKQIGHGCSINSSGQITAPNPQPLCSSPLVNVVTSNIPLNYTTDCPISPPSSGGGGNWSARIAKLNSHIGYLQEFNKNGEYDFEVQSSVSSKIYEFISDTINANPDTVISILSANQGVMEDADVQLVFAYLAKNDYSNALNKTNELGQDKGDWKSLFIKLIDFRSNFESDNLLCENADTYDFFGSYAEIDNKDGQVVAQALLWSGCQKEYTEPHTQPEEENMGSREINPSNQTSEETINTKNSENIFSDVRFNVYPNPSSDKINLYYESKKVSGDVQYIITDLLGTEIRKGVIKSNNNLEIESGILSNGIYIVTLKHKNKLIAKEKLTIIK